MHDWYLFSCTLHIRFYLLFSFSKQSKIRVGTQLVDWLNCIFKLYNLPRSFFLLDLQHKTSSPWPYLIINNSTPPLTWPGKNQVCHFLELHVCQLDCVLLKLKSWHELYIQIYVGHLFCFLSVFCTHLARLSSSSWMSSGMSWCSPPPCMPCLSQSFCQIELMFGNTLTLACRQYIMVWRK